MVENIFMDTFLEKLESETDVKQTLEKEYKENYKCRWAIEAFKKEQTRRLIEINRAYNTDTPDEEHSTYLDRKRQEILTALTNELNELGFQGFVDKYR